MSGSADSSSIRDSTQHSTVPRAVIHKKILDAAASKPKASVDVLADDVSAATVELVEQVLDEYGDPVEQEETTDAGAEEGDAETRADSKRNGGSAATTEQNEEERVDLEKLTERQRQIIHVIYERPEATQADLAEHFGVSAATINKQVNSIHGFDWDARLEFVEGMVNTDDNQQNQDTRSEQDLREQVDEIETRVRSIEDRLVEKQHSNGPLLDDPRTIHKVVHACFDSDQITEEEELQILEAILT